MASATQPVSTFRSLELRPEDHRNFQANYNSRPFEFHHALAGHPLLQPSRLQEAVQCMAKTHPQRLYYELGRPGLKSGWDFDSKRTLSVQDVMARIDSEDALIIASKIQVVLPEYQELLDDLLREIHQVSKRDWERTTQKQDVGILITSPGRITPYHMDYDCNFLMQIAGSKTVHVFDGSNKDVVTTEELEKFYLGNKNAVQYRESSQRGAWQFDFTPGRGIHIPITFPHWVQNGDNVSISLAITFAFQDRSVADICRVNHYLRRVGMTPKRPGESAFSDGLKKLTAKLISRGRAAAPAHS